ncbi:MAG: SDR family NAD(P)-dependent oxidoreductase, partial [Thiohalocapsa sp.]
AARHSWQSLLSALASLWRAGAAVDWRGFDAPYPLAPTDAPTYPFQRTSYWFRADASGAAPASAEASYAGERIALASGGVLFRRRLDTAELPFLADHVVLGDTVVPGASHLVAMLATTGAALTDVVFATPLSLPRDGCTMQLLQSEGHIELYADAGGSWQLHAGATIEPAVRAALAFERDALAARMVEDPDGPAALHAMLADRGIALGPSFRGIRRLWRGDGEALVEIALPPDTAPITPLHPAQLDAAFQALGATFVEGNSGSGSDAAGGALLPLAVDRVVLHRPHSGPLWAHVRRHPDAGGGGEVAVGDVVLADPDGRPVITVSGLTVKRVGAAADPTDGWTYRVAWRAVEDAANSLPAAAALAAAAATARDGTAPPDEHGLAASLERLAGAYAAAALAAIRPDEVVPSYRRLYEHLPNMAAGIAGDPTALLPEAATRYGDRLEIALARRSGAALPAVLRGQADPLAALFGDADGDDGADGSVYSDPPFARMLNAMVVAALRAMAEALPAGRVLRVIEIGAGSGAIFAELREAVPAGRIDYTFTDVSAAFLDAAAMRFADGAVQVARLDIEQPPEGQGFAAGGFDVVVAANVLHATRELRPSLRHAARLLQPHGGLLLLEAVRRSNWSDLVFGLTPGWWRFADTALRPHHPLLPQPHWQDLFGEHFADTAFVASPGGEQLLAIGRMPRPGIVAGREMLVWEAPAGAAPLDLAAAALHAVQSALAQPQPPALRLVTRAAQPIGEMPVDPAQSVLLGLGRVVAIEHPELDCRLVDLPAAAPSSLAMMAPAGAGESAWRDGLWHRPLLQRARLPADAGFVTSGTHLVTGGLGGLGPLLASWLREAGAERVVLMGRTARKLPALPAGVDTMLGDVTQRDDIDRIIAAIEADGPPLRGVFHLAGALSDAAVLRLREDDLAAVFAAKVDGACHLDAGLGTRALDAFVLFGSSAGLIGNAGQGAHAAANAYLGALAVARQRRGLAGLCVDWGAWGEAGTLTRSAVGERLVAAGAGLMPPADALRALGRAIVSGAQRLMIAAIDWRRFLAGYGDAVPAFFADVAPPRTAAMPQARIAAAPVEGDPRADRDALAAFVMRSAAEVLRVMPGETLPSDMPLNEAGLDSLMALELRKALAAGLGLALPATLLFNFPTLDALIEHLSGLVGLGETVPTQGPAKAAAAPPPAAVAEADIVESVRRMSEEEMAAVIAREFAWASGNHG